MEWFILLGYFNENGAGLAFGFVNIYVLECVFYVTLLWSSYLILKTVKNLL